MIRLFLLLLFLLFSLYGGQDNGKDLNQTQNNMIGTTFIVNPVGRYKTIKNDTEKMILYFKKLLNISEEKWF